MVIVEEATPELLQQLFQEQRQQDGYKALLNTNITVLGTIDDHDYGMNNGDYRYMYRKESGTAYVQDFLGLSPQSVMAKRARQGKGVYGVQVFDFSRPHGQELLTDEEAGIDPDLPDWEDGAADSPLPYSPDRSVAVFVIDIRSNRTPWPHGWSKFFYDYQGDFLGEHQWEWLEKALKKSQATSNILVNGLQVHADRFPDGNIAEAWSKFPSAQNRLYNLILESGVRAPILVSGDVHHAQILRKDCQSSTDYKIQSLMELTTSGLTHSWGNHCCSRPDTNWVCQSSHTTWATRHAMTLGQWIGPWTDIVIADGQEGAKDGLQFALELNFGEFEFDWNEGAVQARVLGLRSDRPLLSQRWSFDELNGAMSGSKVTEQEYHVVRQHSKESGPWACVNYRGSFHRVHQAATWFTSLFTVTTLIFSPVAIAAAIVLVGQRCLRRRQKK
jgi:hypothetical protein